MLVVWASWGFRVFDVSWNIFGWFGRSLNDDLTSWLVSWVGWNHCDVWFGWSRSWSRSWNRSFWLLILLVFFEVWILLLFMMFSEHSKTAESVSHASESTESMVSHSSESTESVLHSSETLVKASVESLCESLPELLHVMESVSATKPMMTSASETSWNSTMVTKSSCRTIRSHSVQMRVSRNDTLVSPWSSRAVSAGCECSGHTAGDESQSYSKQNTSKDLQTFSEFEVLSCELDFVNYRENLRLGDSSYGLDV